MRFKSNNTPQPFDGHDRRIILVFIGALGIFLLVRVAMKPEFWDAVRGKNEVAETPEPIVADGLGRPLEDGEFLVVPPGESAIDPEFSEPLTPVQGAEGGQNIPPQALRGVRDNTVGVRRSESPAYYAILQHARQTDPEKLAEAARTVPYAQLMAEPAAWRGRPITIEGRLRRLVPFQAGPNQYQLARLYDAWVFTRDSQSNPLHVVCVGKPELLEPSTMYETPPVVKLTGFFFKREGYQSQGDDPKRATLHSAPLLLAGSFQTEQAQEPLVTRDAATEMIPWLWWFALGTVSLLGIVLWNFTASDWSYRKTRAHELTTPPVTADFREVEAVTTDQMLREMSGS